MISDDKNTKNNGYQLPAMTIKAWAEADRPREKLLLKGKHSLSDAELVAILLGSGSRQQTAVDLAKSILQSVDNNLFELGKCTIKDLKKFNGVGEAKAISIAAALELGRRRQLSDIKTRPQVRCSADSYQAIAPLLMDLPHEEFWILLLSRRAEVIGRVQISQGGVSGTVVDAKMIFSPALEVKASSIILCHNHPSGNPNPSQADKSLTAKLVKAGESLDIFVLDHLIIAAGTYYSFADNSII
jgi:DNA repair protein RadC